MQQFISSLLAFFTAILSLFGISTDPNENEPIDLYHGGDPYIIEHNDETYYTFTTGGGIDIRKIKSFNDTEIIEQKTVFWVGDNGTIKDIWAPEIHFINGKWYIISCAVFNSETVQRGLMPEETVHTEHDDYMRYTFVLESKTDDIFGEYTFKGILAPGGMNNIDGTYLKHNGKLYFVTSSYKAVAYQCLTITEMENPYTLKTDNEGNSLTTLISSPELKWETQGWRVNEGPAVLYKNNKTYIVYSASGFSSGEYCLGMLSLKGDDILNACSWQKSFTRVMYHQPIKNIYNAGHCSFLYRDNGDIYMIYHATTEKDFYSSPRLTFLRKVNFICDYPIFR